MSSIEDKQQSLAASQSPETEQVAPNRQAPHQNAPTRKARGGRKFIRFALLLLGPLAVAAGFGYFYWFGGKIVSTDNAYVQADKVTISAEVSGPITAIMVMENQKVNPGDPLFAIDDRPYRIALDRARANRQAMETDIRTRKINYQQKVNELELAQANIAFASREYKRQSSLDHNQAVPKAQLDSAQHELEVSTLNRAVIETERDEILARLEGSPDIEADKLAEYRLADAEVKNAELNLERTVIRAPFAGTVSKLPKAGKHVSPGAAVMSLIADNDIWIEANLKETDLTHVQVGQQVEVIIDTYPDTSLPGVIESISPGTGAEFAIIPAQNASGNWVKVVQRVPVRIRVGSDERQAAKSIMLRAGMSATVDIDTGFTRPMPELLVSLCRTLHCPLTFTDDTKSLEKNSGYEKSDSLPEMTAAAR